MKTIPTLYKSDGILSKYLIMGKGGNFTHLDRSPSQTRHRATTSSIHLDPEYFLAFDPENPNSRGQHNNFIIYARYYNIIKDNNQSHWRLTT